MVPSLIVAPSAALLLYDAIFGCGSPGAEERCDGTLAPVLFVISLVLAVLGWLAIVAIEGGR